MFAQCAPLHCKFWHLRNPLETIILNQSSNNSLNTHQCNPILWKYWQFHFCIYPQLDSETKQAKAFPFLSQLIRKTEFNTSKSTNCEICKIHFWPILMVQMPFIPSEVRYFRFHQLWKIIVAKKTAAAKSAKNCLIWKWKPFIYGDNNPSTALKMQNVWIFRQIFDKHKKSIKSIYFVGQSQDGRRNRKIK